MATVDQIVLDVSSLTKSYRSAGEQIEVLRGVNLAVAAGERVALTGESGSGKSTLLHLIAGLDSADGGEIRLDDISVSLLSDAGRAALRRDRLGLVFQQFNLIPSLNVRDNLGFQSRIANSLGLDELGLSQAKGLESTVVTVGKRLSSRAYLSFEQGATSASSLVKLRYKLNSKWTLQFQTGTNTALDVLYTWAFD